MSHAYFLGQNDKMAEVATSPPGMPTELFQLRPGVVSIPAIETQLVVSWSANENWKKPRSQWKVSAFAFPRLAKGKKNKNG